jgi:hypothetical protein
LGTLETFGALIKIGTLETPEIIETWGSSNTLDTLETSETSETLETLGTVISSEF